MKFSISKYVWFDGKIIPVGNAQVPVTTHAIHYGTSIFEGIRAYWNSKNLYIFRLKEHIKRFRNSGKFYNISFSFSDLQIENAVINLCKKNKIKKSCYIRPFYFVGQYGINLHVTRKAPTHVAIFTFPFGDLFNKNGITRRSIIVLANDMNLKIKARKISKNELKLADEIFLSGTAAEITPIIKIDKKKVGDGKVGNITRLLMATYSDIVMNKSKKYSQWLTKVYN